MQEKLELFAKLSGDYNPVHLDAEFARETYFGTQIVYGIFQVFCTLESALQTIQTNPKFQNFQAPLFLAQIKATFHAPINKDSAHKMKYKGSFSQIVCGGGGAKHDCVQNHSTLASSNSLDSAICWNGGVFLKVSREKAECMSSISFTLKQVQNLKSQNLVPDSMPTTTQKKQPQGESQTQSLAFDPEILENLFPLCSHFLDKQSIGTLLASTRIVGMQTPGLHSIYSSLSLTQNHQIQAQTNPTILDSQNLHYTHKTHPLLNITTLHFTSPMQGVIKAFIRPQKIPNQNFKSLLNAHTNTLSSKPFATQRALVIGAGKGLGNTCAKLLALGGAQVLATTQNFDESHEHISTINLDILKLNAQTLKTLHDFQPTHLYYFATPSIRAITPNGMLNKKQLFTYLDYYVLAPSRLLNALNSLQAFFQPSSIFVEELPLEFCEYTLAKTALESFAHFLEKQGLHTTTPRLPKVATNQTLSLIPQKLKSPSDALINELLNFAKTQKSQKGSQ